jgi:hypothetical protein
MSNQDSMDLQLHLVYKLNSVPIRIKKDRVKVCMHHILSPPNCKFYSIETVESGCVIDVLVSLQHIKSGIKIVV